MNKELSGEIELKRIYYKYILYLIRNAEFTLPEGVESPELFLIRYLENSVKDDGKAKALYSSYDGYICEHGFEELSLEEAHSLMLSTFATGELGGMDDIWSALQQLKDMYPYQPNWLSALSQPGDDQIS